MHSGFLLDVIVRDGSGIVELLSSEDQSLLICWDSFFFLDLGLERLDSVRALDVDSDCSSSDSLDEYL